MDPHEIYRFSIGRRLHIILRWMRDFISEELDDTGIGAAQFPFLMTIFRNEGISQEQLTQRMAVDKATTARAVKNLMSSGYVTRERNPDDRRAYLLYPTDKARGIHPRLKMTILKWNETFTKPLSGEEEELLRGILDKIIENAPYKEGVDPDGD
jgi:DNA-binding MarR family transcriptional regulator